MENKIYTPTEEHLIKGVELLTQSLEQKEKINSLLELDAQLLAMEEQQDMMDGLAMEVYLL